MGYFKLIVQLGELYPPPSRDLTRVASLTIELAPNVW